MPKKPPPDAPYTVPSMPRTTLTDNQLAQYAYNAGFRGQALVTAISVALAESHGNRYALADTSHEFSVGLWQINVNGYLVKRLKQLHLTSWEDLWNPQTAANAAYQFSGGGKHWGLWSTYVHGSNQKFIARATAAASSVDPNGTPPPPNNPPPTNPYVPVVPIIYTANTTYTADQWNSFIACVTGKGHIDVNPHPTAGGPVPYTITAENVPDILSCLTAGGMSLGALNPKDFIGETLSDLRNAAANQGSIPGPDPLGINGLTGAFGGFFDHGIYVIMILAIGLVVLVVGFKSTNKPTSPE